MCCYYYFVLLLFVFLFVTLTVCVYLGYRRAHCEGYIVGIYRSILMQFCSIFRGRNALSNFSKISELHHKMAPHLLLYVSIISLTLLPRAALVLWICSIASAITAVDTLIDHRQLPCLYKALAYELWTDRWELIMCQQVVCVWASATILLPYYFAKLNDRWIIRLLLLRRVKWE